MEGKDYPRSTLKYKVITMLRRIVMGMILGLLLITAGGCSDGGNDNSQAPAGAGTAPDTVTQEAPPPAIEAAPAGAAIETDCSPSGDLQYICGPENAEDILQVGDSEWLITSGMNGARWGTDTPGHLYLVNHQSRAWEVLFPGDQPVLEQDQTLFPNCPASLNVNNFSGHGLALREQTPGQYLLYVTSHGDREAIEAFRLDAGGGKPVVKWIGCVVLPNTVWPNSVAILADGGFVTSKFMDPTDPEGFNKVRQQVITGGVYEWHPGGGAPTEIEGTQLSGANGILVSPDERYLYVAAFGSNEVVRFDRSGTPLQRTAAAMAVTPDNLRWTAAGMIYTTGGDHMPPADCPQQPCGSGWSVFEIDPGTMTANRVTGVDAGVTMQGASSALRVGEQIWIGTYAGDRIGILPLPETPSEVSTEP